MPRQIIRRARIAVPVVGRVRAHGTPAPDDSSSTRTVIRSDGTDDLQKPQTSTFGFINLRLHHVECIKTTKEVDRDEIVLATIKIEGEVAESNGTRHLKGRAKQGEQVVVGHFSKGDQKHFKSPKVLAKLPFGGADEKWPRSYIALLMMIEKDEGAIGTVVNSAIRSVEKELKAAITAAVASGAIIGSTVPLVGTAIGTAVGAAVGLALNEIKKSRADDVLESERLRMDLERFPGKSGEIPGSKETRVFKGAKGVYKVTLSWAVS